MGDKYDRVWLFFSPQCDSEAGYKTATVSCASGLLVITTINVARVSIGMINHVFLLV